MKSISQILEMGNMPPPITDTTENKHGLYYTGQSYRQEESYECPLCNDREIIIKMVDGDPVGVPCECKAKKSTARKLKASGLTPEQTKYRIEDYRRTEENKNLVDGVGRYLKTWPSIINTDSNSKGFCLVGTPGIGKTMLACIITKDMLDQGIPAVFVPTSDLMSELRQAQFRDDKDGIEAKIDTLAKAPALILDDVGKEKPTEWVQSMYYRLVDLRYRNNLLTGFTSNYLLENLEDRLGEFGPATVSRLIGMASDFILTGGGKDMRLR